MNEIKVTTYQSGERFGWVIDEPGRVALVGASRYSSAKAAQKAGEKAAAAMLERREAANG